MPTSGSLDEDAATDARFPVLHDAIGDAAGDGDSDMDHDVMQVP